MNDLMSIIHKWVRDQIDEAVGNAMQTIQRLSAENEELARRVLALERAERENSVTMADVEYAIEEFFHGDRIRNRIADAVDTFVNNSDEIVTYSDLEERVKNIIRDNVRIEIED